MPNRIREMRQAAGMTLQDVAEKVGTTAVTVSRWEREPQRVTLPVLQNLATAIGVSASDLLGAQQEPVITPEQRLVVAAAHFGIPSEHFAALDVPADMMAPTFLPGDVCYLDTRITVVDRAGVFAMQDREFARLVRAYPTWQGKIRCTGDNELYRMDFTVSPEEIKIIGKVIGYTRKI